MIGDGRIDMDGVDIRVFEQPVDVVVSFCHAKSVADGIQLFAGALADGVHVGVGMALVDGDEFGAKAQPDNGDVNFSLAHALRIAVTSDGPHNPRLEDKLSAMR
jgi:hypothetical protein